MVSGMVKGAILIILQGSLQFQLVSPSCWYTLNLLDVLSVSLFSFLRTTKGNHLKLCVCQIMVKEKEEYKLLRSLASKNILILSGKESMYAIIIYHMFMLLNTKVHKTWVPDKQFYCLFAPQTST